MTPIELPEPLVERITEAAADRGISPARLVEEALEAHLKGTEWKAGDRERRRDRRTILDATRTGAEEHKP